MSEKLNLNHKRIIIAKSSVKRPRKLGIVMRQDEYYSPADLSAINEGIDEIKRGEYVTHADLKRKLGL